MKKSTDYWLRVEFADAKNGNHRRANIAVFAWDGEFSPPSFTVYKHSDVSSTNSFSTILTFTTRKYLLKYEYYTFKTKIHLFPQF